MSEAAQQPDVSEEDQARAALYGLIARLFYAAPDQAVLGQILHAEAFAEGDAPVARAWRDLVDASPKAFPVKLEQEHTGLFVGTGKAEVTPYLTHYTIRFATDTPLVDLRQQLGRWGMARKQAAHEPEDHVSGVCEAMRLAIASQHRSLEEQKNFFERFIYRGGLAFCDAVLASPKAEYYRQVAAFARAFLELEREAFAIAE